MSEDSTLTLGTTATFEGWGKPESNTHMRIVTRHGPGASNSGWALMRRSSSYSNETEFRISTTGSDWIGGVGLSLIHI